MLINWHEKQCEDMIYLGKYKKTRGNWILIKNWENQNDKIYDIFMFWYSFACKCSLNLYYKSKYMDNHSQIQLLKIILIMAYLSELREK